MEFEEMRKIWDTQNEQPLYVINEQAMHNSIISKRNKVNWLANINEIGLILIAIVTSIYLFFKTLGTGNVYAYLPGIALLLTGAYVMVNRLRRKSKINQFDQTMLGTIDHAISNADYLINFSRTFIWWYILPVAIPTLYNMLMKDDLAMWTWYFVITSFVVSFLLVRWELRRCHIPRKQKLEVLRDKLIQDVDSSFIS